MPGESFFGSSYTSARFARFTSNAIFAALRRGYRNFLKILGRPRPQTEVMSTLDMVKALDVQDVVSTLDGSLNKKLLWCLNKQTLS